MKRRSVRRMIVAGLAMALSLSLAACGGGQKQSSEVQSAETTSKDYVYRQEDLKVDFETSSISGLTAVDGTIVAWTYGRASETDEADNSLSYAFHRLKADGTSVGDTTVKLKTQEVVINTTCDTDGNIYIMLTIYAGGEAPVDGVDETKDTYYLVKFDASGAEQWRSRMPYPADELIYNVGGLAVSDATGVVVADTNGVSHYDAATGAPLGELVSAADSQDEYGNAPRLLRIRDGRVILVKQVDDDVQFYEVKASGGMSEKLGSMDWYTYEDVYAGVSHDLVTYNDTGVYAFDLGQDPQMILNYVDSDLNTYGFDQLACVTETQLVVCVEDDATEEEVLAILTKVPPEEVKERQVITLGCYYIDDDVRTQVVRFNKASTDYRIRIIDYESFDTEEDWWAGATKLNTDIVSGNTPDILVLDSDMPVDSYIAKGLLMDMSDYFTKDEELSKLKYLDHIMELFKTDGKMYQVVPYFNIETVAGASSDVAGLSSWTLDDLENLAKAKGVETKNIFGPFEREDALSAAMDLTGAQFIDWGTRECHFDSENFIHLLEFVGEFPEVLDDEEYLDDTSAFWRNGTSLLQRMYLSTFNDYKYMKKGTFGQDITLCGFPSEQTGSGASVYPGLRLAISDTSKVKDGCWEFVRIFLGQEFQSTVDGYWPVEMTRMEKLCELAQRKPFYLNANGQEVEYDEMWHIGDMEIQMDPLNAAEVQEVLDYINTMDSVGNYNESIMNIVTEEAGAYFSGQKTAAEVAGIIQSRVQIFVNENS
ncbi:MAG: extracellular solute-binding protein [Butyrivibrio sp.]|nr:extracellular solute-binding protein [Butyrivibrio sp.]